MGERISSEIHLVDQRNHGESAHHDEMSYQAMADDLHEYVRSRGLAPINLIGHSMVRRCWVICQSDLPSVARVI
jgi:esterase